LGLPHGKPLEVNWDGEAFKNMTNLKTLIIKRVDFSESPKHLPNSLRVLEWWGYPSECFPIEFYRPIKKASVMTLYLLVTRFKYFYFFIKGTRFKYLNVLFFVL
jgi:hypothetical protein